MSSTLPSHPKPANFQSSVDDYYNKKSDYDRAFEAVLAKLDLKGKEDDELPQAKTSQAKPKEDLSKMPSGKEDKAEGHITDQVAKESKDSNASTHEQHNVDTGAKGSSGGQRKATAAEHQATPGPVIASNLPEPASKEELRKRAEELNK